MERRHDGVTGSPLRAWVAQRSITPGTRRGTGPNIVMISAASRSANARDEMHVLAIDRRRVVDELCVPLCSTAYVSAHRRSTPRGISVPKSHPVTGI